jgi:hypothetical protein
VPERLAGAGLATTPARPSRGAQVKRTPSFRNEIPFFTVMLTKSSKILLTCNLSSVSFYYNELSHEMGSACIVMVQVRCCRPWFGKAAQVRKLK